MNFREYIELATKTESNDFNAITDRMSSMVMIRILHACMGLITEVAELVDMVKKHLFYGREFDRTNVVEESGDIFWYLAILFHTLGIDPVDVMERNIAKLKARYGDKFSEVNALDRDLDAERKTLTEEFVPDKRYPNCGTWYNDTCGCKACDTYWRSCNIIDTGQPGPTIQPPG